MTKLPEKWDIEADVLVGGSSGRPSCAICTHNRGGQAIVLESSSKPGEVSSLCQR